MAEMSKAFRRAAIVKMARYDDLTHAEIAETLGCDHRIVARVARQAGLKRNQRCGERVETSDHAPVVVRDLFRHASDQGHTYSSLARAAGISPNVVKQWLRDRSPMLVKFLKCADALGFELVLRRKDHG